VYTLTEKPNHINPADLKLSNKDRQKAEEFNEIFENKYTEDPVEEAFSNEKLEKTIKNTMLLPRQKYEIPLTANQEIGWFSN